MKLKIRELREEFGMTQAALASRLNNVQRNVSNWENGVSEPDCATIVMISNIFHVTIDELFGAEEDVLRPIPKSDRRIINAISKLSEKQKGCLLKFLESMLLQEEDEPASQTWVPRSSSLK